ncbi:MAG: putative bifunctional diguanylate cyclase/phosphodiesterase [Microthrixaceae bacterium]
MTEPASGGAREVAAMLPYCILRYVSRAVGEAQAERIRLEAGETRSMAELSERGAWSSEASVVAVAAAAAVVTGDVHIGRRGGEELFREGRETGLTDLFLAEGSVVAALEAVIAVSSRVTTLGLMRITEQTESSVVVEREWQAGATPHATICDFASGYWACVPSLFGAAGYSVELECRGRGDARCVTRVAWVHDPGSAPDVDGANERGRQMFVRFEQLQETAADLVAAKDVSAVLDRVVDRAGHAVLAPRFLVAVRLHDGGELAVHHAGFADADSARATAVTILSGNASASSLVVDVASPDRAYGCVAAIYPEGTEANEVDRRLLSAYAGLVVAALEAAVAFEQAHHDRDTARSLLELAGRLAQVATSEEVAARLVDALPAVAGSDTASVWLWEPRERLLRLTATSDADQPHSVLSLDEVPGLAALAENPRPVLLGAESANGVLKSMLAAASVRHGIVVPIVARGVFLGLVATGFQRELADDDRAGILDRLTGFADQAATALDNARLVEHMRQQSLHDTLTGLPNRTLIEDRADQALALAQRSRRHVGLLFIDLDRFKNINDTLGHQAGDELIRQVSERLRTVVRESDTVARLGGDEFVILLPEVESEATAAELASRVIDAVREPFTVEGHHLFISCSIGVALTSAGGGHYEGLLQQADAAMYQAKDQGRNTVAVHRAEAYSPRRHQLELESALHKALDRHELAVVYQPQVELESGRIVGVEALLRWHHPTLGTLAPDDFLSIAEDTGLIVEIDRWVRRSALAQVRSWGDAGLPAVRLALNLSTRELRSPSLAHDIAADIAESGVSPGMVEIEITERTVLADSDDLGHILDDLSATGARLAVDDFGTGSSVLSRLQGGPFDTLKIDRSFIHDTASEPASAVVAALVQMGTNLGLDIIAEGVETQAQRTTLIALGCVYGQGYLFSRPVAPDAITALLHEDHARHYALTRPVS